MAQQNHNNKQNGAFAPIFVPHDFINTPGCRQMSSGSIDSDSSIESDVSRDGVMSTEESVHPCHQFLPCNADIISAEFFIPIKQIQAVTKQLHEANDLATARLILLQASKDEVSDLEDTLHGLREELSRLRIAHQYEIMSLERENSDLVITLEEYQGLNEKLAEENMKLQRSADIAERVAELAVENLGMRKVLGRDG